MSVYVPVPRTSKHDHLIEYNQDIHELGMPDMDETHQEFIELLNALSTAKDDEFGSLFHELFSHTEEHFANELGLMKKSGFPATEEHNADHQRILGQLASFLSRVKQGKYKMARAYLVEQMPFWFRTHLATMDSALAAHLKSQS